MRGLLARALLAGGLIGLLDGLFGLAALGFSARHLMSLLVVIALHQSLAVGLALGLKLLVPELHHRLPEHIQSWRQNAAGAPGELGAALSWLVALIALVASLALSAAAIAALEGSLATKLYVQILQTLVSLAILAAGTLLTWRCGRALRSLSFGGPFTRQRLLIAALFVGSLVYAYLWFERDLLFKEIPPVLGAILAAHLLAMFWAQLPAKGASLRSLGAQALGMILVLALLGGLQSAAPMLRRGAPASQQLIAALDPLIDWDGDGVSSHFGAQDCAPFDAEIFPGAVDLPDDGIDQDCYRGDLSSAGMAVTQVTKLPDVGHIRRPKKVVLISVDALRPDRLGVYGYKKNRTSPGIDAWAKDAVIFDNAYTSGPYTIAAIPGLLTGRGISQIPNYLAEKGSYKLASELKTLPEIMRKLGYRTAAVTSGLQPRENGFAQGIEQLWVVTKGKADTADKVAAIAKRWLAKPSDKPAFLWLHFFDPHDPYKPIKGYNFGRRSSDRYDASIAFMDHHLSPLLKQLDEGSDAAVVLLADHGEAFGEHGATNHGHNVYRENARIPLIIKWPGAKPRRISEAVSILDILPTLVQLGGAKESPGFGQSLLPQLLGETGDLGRGVLTESYRKGQLYALSTASHRLIFVQDEGRYELYNTLLDPGELDDIHGRDIELSERLEKQLYEHLAQGVLLRRGLTVQRMRAANLPPGAALSQPQGFGESLELVGFRWFIGGKTAEKPEYVLSLYWRALKPMQRSWRIAVGVKTGKRSFNKDHTPGYGYVPGRGTYPTKQWPVGALIEDQVIIGRLDKLGIRDYAISLGVYNGSDKLLPVEGGLEQTPKGTRVILHKLSRVKPLIWGPWNKARKKGSR